MNLSTYTTAHLLGENYAQSAQLLDLSVESVYAQNEAWFDQLAILSKAPQVYYGGYLETRFFYQNESLFGSGINARNIHLGLDLWVSEGTSIYCPINARIKSISYNDNPLDYGHTLILEHRIEGRDVFYSLYGHLNSFHTSFKIGHEISAGNKIAEVGLPHENGGWPPHLHFQLIKDLGSFDGDYPGVCTFNELEYYKTNCPDPTPIFTKYA